MTHSFTCEYCGGVFESDWSEDSAIVEYQEKFTDEERATGAVKLCDGCYRLVMARRDRSVLP